MEYELESETSTGSTLLLYILSLPILLPASSPPLPVNFSLSYNTMSQHDLNTIIRQQQEQLVAIQVLLAVGGGATSAEMARPQIFNGTYQRSQGLSQLVGYI